MLQRGINYDIGTDFREGVLTRQEFNESVIKNEIEIIRHELHCDAVRLSGFDLHR